MLPVWGLGPVAANPSHGRDRHRVQRDCLYCILLCRSAGAGADCWVAGAGSVWNLPCGTGSTDKKEIMNPGVPKKSSVKSNIKNIFVE